LLVLNFHEFIDIVFVLFNEVKECRINHKLFCYMYHYDHIECFMKNTIDKLIPELK
jgi:hypothetical protein